MLAPRFKTLATPLPAEGTRRSLLALLTAIPLSGAFLGLNENTGVAKRRRRHKKKHRKIPKIVTSRVTFTGSQMIPSGAQTLVQFNAIDYDTHPPSFDLTTSHFTAPYSGSYTVNVFLAWSGAAAGIRRVLLVKNETIVIGSGEGIPSGGSTLAAVSVTVRLRHGESLAAFCLQDSGAPVDVSSAVFSDVLIKRKS
jgi:hypothetical protein